MEKRRKSTEPFYFDDCPICQAQQRADGAGRSITVTELETAFAEAAKLPGAVSDQSHG